jgi:hypothetical protein
MTHTLPNRLLIAASSSSRGKLVMNKVERQSMVTDISCPFRRSLARADATESTAWNSRRAESDARESSESIVVSRMRPHYKSARCAVYTYRFKERFDQGLRGSLCQATNQHSGVFTIPDIINYSLATVTNLFASLFGTSLVSTGCG